MPAWINYKELKQEISFEDVLEHYHVPCKVKGEQAKASCPLPGHESKDGKPSLSIHLGRGIFQCFGCGAKGNVLEFIALLEGLDPKDGKSFRKAALLAQERFCYKDNRPASCRTPKSVGGRKPQVLVNPPLDFSLKGLDTEHPFFTKHELEPRTVSHFGLGYCSRGYLRGRIAIPLHDRDGQLIGYAGRIVDESRVDGRTSKYLFPSNRERDGVKIEFDPTAFLYNASRLNDPVDELIVVEQCEDVWQLWQAGHRSTVALLGEPCPRLAELVCNLVQPDGRMWLAGYDDTALLPMIASERFVRYVHCSKLEPAFSMIAKVARKGMDSVPT